MSERLKVGAAKVDITPPHPVPLAGFAHRQGNHEGVSHPLHARVLFFEQGHGRELRRAVIVSADLIWWGDEQADGLRLRLGHRWGVERSSVILHATHTHSGPQTSSKLVSGLGRPDPGYLETMEANVLEGVERAAESLETVRVERGTGRCPMGVNRRKPVGEEIRMAPNEAGPVDHEVNVIRFRALSGTVRAVLVHYACHPTTTDNNRISSEFPGVAMESVEAELGGEAMALYLQGCCGDVRPALVRNGEFYRGGDAEVGRLGRALAREVLAVLDRPMQSIPAGPLGVRATTISLPLQKLPTSADLEACSHRDDVIGEWSRLLLRKPDRVQGDASLEMSLLHIADDLSLLALNGEVVVEYGLFIRRQFSGSVLPIPYSNGMVGYIPTAQQILEGGYEARESIFYFGLPAPFATSTEKRIRTSIMKLVREENVSSDTVPLRTENVDRLKVKVYSDREGMGVAAGRDVVATMRQLLSEKERIRMVFAAAPSQKELLRTLSEAQGVDWSRVTVFHMDEYVGLSKEAPQSFARFLNDALFDAVEPGEVHLIDGTNDATAECERYGTLIQKAPIDVVCLGIGENGHIAFNDPPVADFDDRKVIKPVKLEEASRQQQVNDGLFPSIEEVPTHALTLTIPSLMAGSHLFCVVPGPTKRSAVECTLRGPVTTSCPASILRQHPDCTLYVDADAYGGERRA